MPVVGFTHHTDLGMIQMLESMNWQMLLFAYLIVGVIASAILWRKRASKRKTTRQTFANELAAILEPLQDPHKTPARLFLEKRLIPASALLFTWLVWPVIVAVRLLVAMLHVVKNR